MAAGQSFAACRSRSAHACGPAVHGEGCSTTVTTYWHQVLCIWTASTLTLCSAKDDDPAICSAGRDATVCKEDNKHRIVQQAIAIDPKYIVMRSNP
jgi:hypothetical protein